ncbi:hypothetical protein AABC07_09030, partial [Streptomyces sp. LNU-CPARS28]
DALRLEEFGDLGAVLQVGEGAGESAGADAGTGEDGGSRRPVGAGVNGATALGTRPRFLDRRKAGSSR